MADDDRRLHLVPPPDDGAGTDPDLHTDPGSRRTAPADGIARNAFGMPLWSLPADPHATHATDPTDPGDDPSRLSPANLFALWEQLPEPTVGEPRATTAAFDMRVELLDITPPVWREFTVRSDATLSDLHEILQTVLGWTNSHLHQFTREGARPFLTTFDLAEGEEGVPETDVRLDQVFVKRGDSLTYDYDFGDGWRHDVTLQSFREVDGPVPTVLRGAKRAVPPEDVGGPGGYEELVALLAAPGGPTTAEDAELLSWAGDWHPERIDTEEIAAELRLLETRPDPDDLPEELQELLGRSYWRPLFLRFLAMADLRRPIAPEEAKATVAPWQMFLEVVGDGLTMTQAGWLPPAVVQRLVDELDEPHYGTGRPLEIHMPRVHCLRTSAVDLGLARLARGKLTVTSAGRNLANDPAAMLRHIAGRIPSDRKGWERDSAWLTLIARAAPEGLPTFGNSWLDQGLASLHWRFSDEGRRGLYVWEAAPRMFAALRACGDGEALARAVLARDMPTD